MFRALIALALLLALWWPLHRMLLAGERPEAAPEPATAPAATLAARPLHLQVSFTSPPASLRVLWLGDEIWQVTSPPRELEREVTLKFPPEGVELQFEIAWPEETRGAARVRLTDPEGNILEKQVFGEGAVKEVLAFP